MRASEIQARAASHAHTQSIWESEERLFAGIQEAERFFMGESKVQRALAKVTRLLDEDGIQYALIGAMALNAYGYQRVTVDVDLLLSLEGLAAFKATHLGLEYVKLASGMTAPHRLKDLADVIEVIRALKLPAGFGEDLHPYVRGKFEELWQAAQAEDRE